jgi:hypothetical protein
MTADPLLHAPDRAGILYAEDFDGPATVAAPVPEPEPAVIEPSFSLQAMEDARRSAAEGAVREARNTWERSDDHARTLALCAVAAELTAAQDSGRGLAEAAADGTVRTILTLAAGLLPSHCARHGGAEVRHLLGHLLPALHREPRVAVRVSPAVADAVRRDLALLDDDLAARITVTAVDGLASGDARVTWTDGGLVRDTRAIHAAMTKALAELGLIEPATTTADNRSMAHAD